MRPDPPGPEGPRTLTLDCGGTGLKACVLNVDGDMVSDRVRVRTSYPCPPETMVAALVGLARRLPAYDRVSVGFPGMVRHGVVLATPHYVTVAGPFSARDPGLVEAWTSYDVRAALERALGRPTRVANDAEVQGCAVIHGKGVEMVLTLGTGVGCALFEEGRILPKIELSQHPFRKGRTYDEYLGNHARKAVGNARWTRRVQRALDAVRPVFWPDRLFLGGGNTKHLRHDVGADVEIVPNAAGLLGGIRLWDHPEA
ncbi:MAG: ROK family protein [Actinomycetota bacterium]